MFFKKARQAKRRQKFYAALRSGEYEQGYNHLQIDGKFCCLGVACEVAIKDGLKLDSIFYGDVTVYDGEDGSLPDSVRRWYGFKSWNPMINVEDGHSASATRANDELKLPFTKIADAFERTYDGR